MLLTRQIARTFATSLSHKVSTKSVPVGTRCIPREHFASTHKRCFSGSIPNAQRADGDLISIRDRFELKGQNFVITGGGRGIGYAIARGIAEMGGNVAVIDASPKPVQDFANLRQEFGVKTKFFQADVTDETSLVNAFEETIKDFGSLDGW